jgi:hypothetical protein
MNKFYEAMEKEDYITLKQVKDKKGVVTGTFI